MPQDTDHSVRPRRGRPATGAGRGLAVHIEASLAGVDMKVAPIQALLAGGVMLATPNSTGVEALEGAIFRLDEAAPAGWEHWHPEISLPSGVPAMFAKELDVLTGLRVVLVATNADSIGEGDPIFYRGLQIGSLAGSKLGADGTRRLRRSLRPSG